MVVLTECSLRDDVSDSDVSLDDYDYNLAEKCE